MHINKNTVYPAKLQFQSWGWYGKEKVATIQSPGGGGYLSRTNDLF